METLREIIAASIFIIGTYFLLSMIGGFQWDSLLGCIICFILAYFIWPSKTRGQRVQDNAFLDTVEFIIEVPVELFLWLIRLFCRPFNKSDGDFDIDIDL
jgi:hypothetical protein